MHLYTSLSRYFLKSDYPIELIKLVIDYSFKSGIANLAAICLYVWALIDIVPGYFLSIWLIGNFLIFAARFFTFEKLKAAVKNNDIIKLPLLIHWITALIFLNSCLWGASTWLTYFYAEDVYIFFNLMILLGISGGAIGTISPVNHLFMTFVFPMMFCQFIILLISGNTIFLFIAILIILYTFVVYGASQSLYFYISSSIEQRKAIEHARLEAEKANEAKSNFLANMSHEVRTPINAILGFSELALKKTEDKKQENYLQHIFNSCESLLSVINDILDSSKISANKLNVENIPFSLHKVANQVCAMIYPKANKKNNTLTISISPELPYQLIGDPLRISQILTNIINNANKFTNDGQISLEISTYEQQTIDKQMIHTRFKISDTGIGIKECDIDKIFDLFSQADVSTTRQFGGSGLGLSISKNLIELMGGEISVESKFEKGTSFYFDISFAYIDKKEDKNSIFSSVKFTPDIKQLEEISFAKILLVDDCEINRVLALEILENWGFIVATAINGLQATEQVEQQHYDLILMDVQMPIMDGYEACKIIRTKKDMLSTPIIAMTAHAMTGDRDKMIAKGMSDYISKPFRQQDLFSTLYRCLKEK